jgi:hypothetical protein
VVKSIPEGGAGKAKSVPLGSINRATLGISDKLRQSCSPAELKEIEAWVKRYQAVDELKYRYAALTLPEQIGNAIRWFEKASPVEAYQVLDDTLTATAALRKVLTKRGLL